MSLSHLVGDSKICKTWHHIYICEICHETFCNVLYINILTHTHTYTFTHTLKNKYLNVLWRIKNTYSRCCKKSRRLCVRDPNVSSEGTTIQVSQDGPGPYTSKKEETTMNKGHYILFWNVSATFQHVLHTPSITSAVQRQALSNNNSLSLSLD